MLGKDPPPSLEVDGKGSYSIKIVRKTPHSMKIVRDVYLLVFNFVLYWNRLIIFSAAEIFRNLETCWRCTKALCLQVPLNSSGLWSCFLHGRCQNILKNIQMRELRKQVLKEKEVIISENGFYSTFYVKFWDPSNLEFNEKKNNDQYICNEQRREKVQRIYSTR